MYGFEARVSEAAPKIPGLSDSCKRFRRGTLVCWIWSTTLVIKVEKLCFSCAIFNRIPFMWQKVHFTDLRTLKRGVGVPKPILLFYGHDLLFLRIFKWYLIYISESNRKIKDRGK